MPSTNNMLRYTSSAGYLIFAFNETNFKQMYTIFTEMTTTAVATLKCANKLVNY